MVWHSTGAKTEAHSSVSLSLNEKCFLFLSGPRSWTALDRFSLGRLLLFSISALVPGSIYRPWETKRLHPMGSVRSCYYNTDGATGSSPPYLKEAQLSENGGGTAVLHHQPSRVITFKLQMQQKMEL